MTQVNLLPPEFQQRHRQTRLVTLALLLGALAVGVVLMFYFLQSSKLAEAEQQLAQEQARIAQISGRISELEQFEVLKQRVTERQALVDRLNSGEVLWSTVLTDVSRVIPAEVSLTAMNGTLIEGGQPAGGTPVATTGDVIGSITFSGQAVDQPSVALWLTRLEQVEGWANPWITQSTKGGEDGSVITFSGTVDLTSGATADARAQQ